MRPRGFTLIELLIAMALLAVLMALVYSALNVQMRAAEKSAARAQDSERLALGARFLRRELGQALPLVTRSGGQARVEFSGAARELQFAAVLPPHRGVPGVYRVHLRVEPGAGGERLTVAYQLLRAEPGATADTEPALVLDSIEAPRFSYYGEPRERAAPMWLESWTDPGRAPLAVRFEFRNAQGSHVIVAPVRTAVHAPARGRSGPQAPPATDA